MIAIVAIGAALILGIAIGRHRAQGVQNRGEARLSRELMTRFPPPDYHLLNNVTLRLKDGTTQIDHILVSRFGVFVIETKDFGGWIFGNENDRYWTQVFFRAKFRFQNPIRQNYRHVCAVRELLDFLDSELINSAVVFAGDAEFKTNVPRGVFTLPQFLTYVGSCTTELISPNRVQFSVGRLEVTRLAITNATDVEHVQELRTRFGSDD